MNFAEKLFDKLDLIVEADEDIDDDRGEIIDTGGIEGLNVFKDISKEDEKKAEDDFLDDFLNDFLKWKKKQKKSGESEEDEFGYDEEDIDEFGGIVGDPRTGPTTVTDTDVITSPPEAEFAHIDDDDPDLEDFDFDEIDRATEKRSEQTGMLPGLETGPETKSIKPIKPIEIEKPPKAPKIKRSGMQPGGEGGDLL